MSSVE